MEKKNIHDLLFEYERVILFFEDLNKKGQLCYGGMSLFDVKAWTLKGIESEIREG